MDAEDVVKIRKKLEELSTKARLDTKLGDSLAGFGNGIEQVLTCILIMLLVAHGKTSVAQILYQLKKKKIDFPLN